MTQRASIPSARKDGTSMSLCAALGRLQADERLEVVLSGVYQDGYETSVFFQPEHRECTPDVRPSTWAEVLPEVLERSPGFQRLVEREHRAKVTFAGELQGPHRAGPDDLSLPVMGAYANRIANRRYGHMNAFRTRFVVKQILDFRSVAPSMPSYGEWSQPRKGTPLLLGADLPRYPAAAQKAGIEGAVTVEVRVANGVVIRSLPIAGDTVLVAEVLESVKTWRFQPGTEARFTTTFSFELERRLSGVNPNTRLELRLPEYARIVGAEGW